MVFGLNKIRIATQNTIERQTLTFYMFLFVFEIKILIQKG